MVFGTYQRMRAKGASWSGTSHNIIIDHSVGETGHNIELVNGLNAKDKLFLSMLMSTAQLHGTTIYYK